MIQVCYTSFFCLLVSATIRGELTTKEEVCHKAFDFLPGQGLDQKSFENGANYSGHILGVSDSVACMEACCSKEDCHLALVRTPQDAAVVECFLVNCMQDGGNVCLLQSLSLNLSVYLRKEEILNTDLNKTKSSDICSAPALVGPCRAAFPRFYYNVTEQGCRDFVYGGCDGNGNNFETEEECMKTCSSGDAVQSSVPSGPAARKMLLNGDQSGPSETSVPEMTLDDFAEWCQPQAVTGFCRAAHKRYFYNSSAGACQLFIYGGCGGNKNNYMSLEKCQTTCTASVVAGRKLLPDDMASEELDACSAAPITGSCRAAFSKFYFDPSSQECLPFIYGGCGGNANRYDSQEECLSSCTGGRSRWSPVTKQAHLCPAAFFLMASLAIMSALLLVGLILLSVRRVQSGRRRRTHSDKEELLPAEELSEGQLPKPMST